MFGHYEFDLSDFLNTQTNESKNCDIIKQRLNQKCINTKEVGRHGLFNNDYYLITVCDNTNVTEKKIADALDIPLPWVGYYAYPGRYAIKEKEFNEKYCNTNGLIHWNDFNLREALSNPCSKSTIENHLNNFTMFNNNKVACYPDFILIKSANCSAKIIAERLNIPVEAVEDVSLSSNDIQHIVMLHKVGGC